MSGRDLNHEENERVRAAIRELMKQLGENQSKFAPRIGLEQPSLSSALNGRNGFSYGAARRVAALMRVDVNQLLGAPTEPTIDRSDSQVALVPDLTAIGNHPRWQQVRAEIERDYPEDYPRELLDDVERGLSLSHGIPEYINSEIVRRYADAVKLAKREVARRRAEEAAAQPAGDAPTKKGKRK